MGAALSNGPTEADGQEAARSSGLSDDEAKRAVQFEAPAAAPSPVMVKRFHTKIAVDPLKYPLTARALALERAAKLALKQKREAFEKAELELEGFTEDESIRHRKFNAREPRYHRERAEIYAMNRLMREREQARFEKYVVEQQLSEAVAEAMRLQELAAETADDDSVQDTLLETEAADEHRDADELTPRWVEAALNEWLRTLPWVANALERRAGSWWPAVQQQEPLVRGGGHRPKYCYCRP
jgi:hypothetical protein